MSITNCGQLQSLDKQTAGVLQAHPQQVQEQDRENLLIMQDSLDLVSLGQGHLLEQGHELGIPVQHQRVTLSYDCIPQTLLHHSKTATWPCKLMCTCCFVLDFCHRLLPQTFATDFCHVYTCTWPDLLKAYSLPKSLLKAATK